MSFPSACHRPVILTWFNRGVKSCWRNVLHIFFCSRVSAFGSQTAMSQLGLRLVLVRAPVIINFFTLFLLLAIHTYVCHTRKFIRSWWNVSFVRWHKRKIFCGSLLTYYDNDGDVNRTPLIFSTFHLTAQESEETVTPSVEGREATRRIHPPRSENRRFATDRHETRTSRWKLET